MADVAIFFLLGLAFGSLINVVVYRLNLYETVTGRSHCPSCRKKIVWHDNIPLLSFILLGARCRDCGDNISWQYPIVELAAGILFALTGFFFFDLNVALNWVETLLFLGALSLFLVIFVYDLKHMEIPMTVVWTALGWILSFSLLLDWIKFPDVSKITDLRLVSGLIAGAVAFLFFFSLSYFSKEKWMGAGDAYVAMVAGALVGWSEILPALVLSFTIGALFGILMMVFSGKNLKSEIPFAPYIITGAILAVFLPEIFPEIGSLFNLIF